MCFVKAEPLLNYSFGTCQNRKIFPHIHPQSLLGNKFPPIRGAPNRGPGCYIAEDDMTPYPGMYQTVNVREQTHKPNFAPFNALLPRFWTYSKDSYYPGPTTYNLEIKPPKRVRWPMKFGSPDWAQVPCLQKRTLRTELPTDKDFRKHRNRLAYLSLYYD
ncbi:PREDICTED: protein pitchfork-like isoform X3 [Bison bison bison]|uniref:Protein pitchfork-like isoform X3 n=1 Tax=Bison bison bison TaxID=43346 RepID=A0A6P3GQM0_BISBB|nr:PREDICTED: protein pitchfork-like isoform X3 [Bison bison bison]